MDYVKEIECKIIADLKGFDIRIKKLAEALSVFRGKREHALVALRSIQKGLKNWDCPVETYPEPLVLPEPGVEVE
mgnify:CR=1 FL=1